MQLFEKVRALRNEFPGGSLVQYRMLLAAHGDDLEKARQDAVSCGLRPDPQQEIARLQGRVKELETTIAALKNPNRCPNCHLAYTE